MGLKSCIYEGWLRHRRFVPVRHEFRNRLFLVYLDLDELPRVFRRRWLWSARRPAPAWFRRADYLGDPRVPLADAVRDLVEERTGQRPAGPIRLLTHLRTFGYVFNPVSFYYCFDAEDRNVETAVAEVTNTPWNERHAYVLPQRNGVRRHRFRKEFHVSPFFGMDFRYDWTLPEPGPRLFVHMENHRPDGRHFDATLSLQRREMTGPVLARALLRYPFLTLRVTASIYWNALRLRWKRCPFHAHPGTAQ